MPSAVTRRTLTAVPAILITSACSVLSLSQAVPTSSGGASLSAYQREIKAMTPYCTQDAAQLSAMITKIHQLEAAVGLDDETITQLAGHLLAVVSAYKSRVSCVDPFAAYLTM